MTNENKTKVYLCVKLLTSNVPTLTVDECLKLGFTATSMTKNMFGTYPPPVEVQRDLAITTLTKAICGDLE